MSWYDQSQSMSQGFRLYQKLEVDEFSESCFPEATAIMRKLGLTDILSDFAKAGKYRGGMDYLLPTLYPEYEKAVRAYYEGKGKKIIRIEKADKLKELDVILSNALWNLYQHKKNLESQPEGPTEDKPEVMEDTTSTPISVSPSSSEATVTPQQIYGNPAAIQVQEGLVPSQLRRKRDRRK